MTSTRMAAFKVMSQIWWHHHGDESCTFCVCRTVRTFSAHTLINIIYMQGSGRHWPNCRFLCIIIKLYVTCAVVVYKSKLAVLVWITFWEVNTRVTMWDMKIIIRDKKKKKIQITGTVITVLLLLAFNSVLFFWNLHCNSLNLFC